MPLVAARVGHRALGRDLHPHHAHARRRGARERVHADALHRPRALVHPRVARHGGREQLADLDVERRRQRREVVERQPPGAGLQAAERGRRHAGALGDLLLREPALHPDRLQPRADDVVRAVCHFGMRCCHSRATPRCSRHDLRFHRRRRRPRGPERRPHARARPPARPRARLRRAPQPRGAPHARRPRPRRPRPGRAPRQGRSRSSPATASRCAAPSSTPRPPAWTRTASRSAGRARPHARHRHRPRRRHAAHRRLRRDLRRQRPHLPVLRRLGAPRPPDRRPRAGRARRPPRPAAAPVVARRGAAHGRRAGRRRRRRGPPRRARRAGACASRSPASPTTTAG